MKNKVIGSIFIILIISSIIFMFLFIFKMEDLKKESIELDKKISSIEKSNEEKNNKLDEIKEKNYNQEKNINNMTEYINSLDMKVKEYEK